MLGKHKKTFSLRIKLVIVLIVFTVSTIAAPFISTTDTYAANIDMSDNPEAYDSQIKSYLYYTTIKYCMEHAALSTGWRDKSSVITSTDASGGAWFDNDIKMNITPYMNGTPGVSDGSVSCDSAAMINAAARLWGTSAINILCNSNFKRTDKDGDCTDTSDPKTQYVRAGSKTDSRDKFDSYVKGLGNISDINDAKRYLFGKSLLSQACMPTVGGIPSKTPYNSSAIDKSGLNDVSVAIVNNKIATKETGSYPINVPSTSKWVLGFSLIPIVGSIAGLLYAADKYDKDHAPKCSDYVSGMEGENNKYVDAYVKAINDWNAKNPSKPITSITKIKEATEPKSTCNITGVGWIVCPVVRFLSEIADWSFGLIKDSFLKTDTKILTGVNNSNPTYDAWKKMRDFANIAFVIAFLIIIFSQMTSVGITNYGIKKLLPKIIIAAILVNLSYFICQVAVDISNIFGYSLKSLLSGLVEPTGPAVEWAATTGSTVFVGLAGTALAASVAWASLGALIPVVIAAIVSLVMILFILVARQALIILLIVLSPLAFVALLLPNTSDWYKKWQKTFVAMLLVFPIVSLVFGVSTFASVILQNVFVNTDDNMGQMMAAAVLVLPLFVVPSLLKKSLDGVGGIGAKINGMGDTAGGWLGKKGSKYYDNTAIARGRKAREQSKTMYQDRRYAEKLSETDNKGNLTNRARLTRAMARGVRGNLPGGMQTGTTKFANERLDAYAASSADENFEKQVSAESATFKGADFDAIKSIAKDQNVSEARRVAAIRETAKKGSYNDRRELYASSSTATNRGRTSISDGFYAAGDQKVFGSQFGGQILAGSVHGDDDLNNQLISQIEKGSLNASALADEKLVDHIIAMSQGAIKDSKNNNYVVSDKAKENLFKIAHEAVTSPTMGTQLSPALRDKLNKDIYS